MALATVESVTQILQELKLKAKCINISKYKHFTSYDLKLESDGKIKKILNNVQELSLALKEKNPIVKILPEEGIVRLQIVENQETISWERLYRETPPRSGILPCLLGEANNGQPVWMDTAANPHLLIAGCTGSGKSVLLHNIIANLLKLSFVDLYLVDTKKVEFNIYQNKVASISQDYASANSILNYLFETMESTFNYLKKQKYLNIRKKVLIIDEAADLILADKNNKFQQLLIKLVSKSRAAGIYVILATQRPSSDIITGIIKANFPARLALKVGSRIDSQIILDTPGAELLVGKGDALFKNSHQDLIRFQTAFINPKKY